MSEDSKIYLFSRYAIGQRNDAFYDLTLNLLLHVFLKSLKSQENKDFFLVLLVDLNIPQKYVDAINSYIDGAFGFYIYRHCPFSNFSINPSHVPLFDELGVKPFSRINQVRVDCDDAVSVTFISTLKLLLTNHLKAPGVRRVAINPIKGAQFWWGTNKSISICKPDYSVQFLSDIFDESFIYIYRYSHKSISDLVSSEERDVGIYYANDIMWLRGIHVSSETNLSVMQLTAFVPLQLLIFIRNAIQRLRPVGHTKWLRLLPPSGVLRNFSIDLSYLSSLADHNIELPKIPNRYHRYKFKNPNRRLLVKEEILEICKVLSVSDVQLAKELREVFYKF